MLYYDWVKIIMTKHHYVYHSCEEWGREYIGIRSCDCLPEEDTRYFGSFKDKTFFPTEKTILFVCETREEAMEIEIELHDFFDVAVNPRFANKAKATSTKFDTTGVSKTEEDKRKISKANTGKIHTEAQNKAQSERKSGKKNHMFGRTGALSPSSKAIIAIQPDDTERHFGSGHEAARELGIDQGNLRYFLKNGHVSTKGKFKGWRFLYKNSENF